MEPEGARRVQGSQTFAVLVPRPSRVPTYAGRVVGSEVVNFGIGTQSRKLNLYCLWQPIPVALLCRRRETCLLPDVDARAEGDEVDAIVADHCFVLGLR